MLAVGVIGGLDYYIYRTKQPLHTQPNNPPKHRALRVTSLRWIKSIPYYKMDNKSIVNDLYHASLISVFVVGYSMLGKKILKMAPPSIQKFDLEDTG